MTTTIARFNEILGQESSDTLEKLAFMFTFAEGERDRFEDDGAVGVQVPFTGPFGGRLQMVASAAILQELAANMLGIDEDEEIEETQKHDALKEALNVICGNVLPAIAGRQAVFNIGAPEMVVPAGEPEPDPAPVAIARLGLDQGSCDLFFYVDGELPENLPVE